MRVFAIDPGNIQSAFIYYDSAFEKTAPILEKGIVSNAELLTLLENTTAPRCVIEMVASYGMAVGMELFETVFWIGRFAQHWESATGEPAFRLFRRDVKMNLCHNNSGKDSNVRMALIDRFGPEERKAIGLKKTPGPLYKVRGDEWAALALAVTFTDKHQG